MFGPQTSQTVRGCASSCVSRSPSLIALRRESSFPFTCLYFTAFTSTGALPRYLFSGLCCKGLGWVAFNFLAF